MEQSADRQSFSQLNATELYCPNCRRAMPVRKILLLILPEGDKYHYTCCRCNESLGDTLIPRRESPTVLLR